MTLTLTIDIEAIVNILRSQGLDFMRSVAVVYLECGDHSATKLVREWFEKHYRAKLTSLYSSNYWLFEFDCDEDLIAFKLALL